MKKIVLASAASVTLFLLMFLLWPVAYTHTATVYEQPCPPPGSPPGIYNCPMETAGNNGGYVKTTVGKKGSFIVGLSKPNTHPHLESPRNALLLDAAVAVVGWLVVYEALDKLLSGTPLKKPSRQF